MNPHSLHLLFSYSFFAATVRRASLSLRRFAVEYVFVVFKTSMGGVPTDDSKLHAWHVAQIARSSYADPVPRG